MKFLKYVAMVPFIFLLSNLAQAETINVAAAKDKVVKLGKTLIVNYKLDNKNNIAVYCDYSEDSVDNKVTWSLNGQQKSCTLDITLTSKEFLSHYNSHMADASGAITIKNVDDEQSMTVTCEYRK